MTLNRSAHLIVEPDANIYSYPIRDQAHPADKRNQLTIGDTHGNALYVLYFLVRQNVLDLDEEAYKELVRIYKADTDKLTQADIKIFNSILEDAQVHDVGTIRFIGDELADRGKNDYFTLKIIEWLCKKKAAIEILLSNHSFEFIESYENFNNDFYGRRFKSARFSFEDKDQLPFAHSLFAMQWLIDRGVIEGNEVFSIIDQYYKPNLRALSYTITEDRSKVTLYTHAPVDFDAIEAVAYRLGVPYSDDTVDALTDTIAQINAAFKVHVDNNVVYTLCLSADKLHLYDMYNPNVFGYSIDNLIWNRNTNILKRPYFYNGYYVDFGHGHDENAMSKSNNIYNLDGSLGKYTKEHTAEYHIHFSQENPALGFTLEHKSEKALTAYLGTLEEKPTLSKNAAHSSLSSEEPAPLPPNQTDQADGGKLELNQNFLLLNDDCIVLLTQRIKDLREYGIELLKEDVEKGLVAIVLAEKLFKKADSFFKKNINARCSMQDLQEFTKSFKSLLHSKDDTMSNHRNAWKPLTVNIGIAMTIFGLAVLAGKLIHSRIVHGKFMFFFQQTKRQAYLDKIENAVNDLEKSSVNKFKHA